MKIKFIILGVVSLLGLSLFLAPVVDARACDSDLPKQQALCAVEATNPGTNAQDSEQQVHHVLKQVIHILGLVVGVASVIVITVQGLRLVVSGGSGETVKGARNGIIYAIVGLVVAALAQVIVYFVIGKL